MAHPHLKDSFNHEPTPAEADAFVKAAGNGDNAAVTGFLKKYSGSIDIFDVRVYVHQTALMRAADGGHKDIVELLLKNGADINKKNESGWTALTVAAENGNTDIVDLLLKNGADINTCDSGWSLLMGAAWNFHVDTVKLLLERGAPINDKDNRGETVLMQIQGQLERLLADQNIDSNIRNEWIEKSRQIIKLLEAGPKVQKKPPRHFKL